MKGGVLMSSPSVPLEWFADTVITTQGPVFLGLDFCHTNRAVQQ